MASTNTKAAECMDVDAPTCKQLHAANGLYEPAVSRQVQTLDDRVATLPTNKIPKYTFTRKAFGSGDKLPLHVINDSGDIIVAAHICLLAVRGFFVELCAGGSPLLLGADGSGVFDDLPYYLHDLRPQGFVGRQIAQALAEGTNEFPNDLNRWTANHVGRYLLSNGENLPGNFHLGDAANVTTQRAPIAYSQNDYADIADAVIAGELAGYVAGGEQPKFTLYSAERSAFVQVKFSPAGQDSIARRWRDILITEYHATRALLAQSIPTANVELIESGDRLFLESQRFDRTEQHGRSSMISLQMIDAEFVGNGADWPVVMKALATKKLISQEHYVDACMLWEFGYLINNTDMHLGNLSLGMSGNIFKLLPMYDMCSMGFAPAQAELKPLSFSQRSPNSRLNCLQGNEAAQAKVHAMAHDFWRRVAGDSRISEEFRRFLAESNLVEGLG